jgi:hypothetical protein
MLEQDETLRKRLCRLYLALEGAVERSHDDDLSEARHQLAEGDDVAELRSGTAGETPSTSRRDERKTYELALVNADAVEERSFLLYLPQLRARHCRKHLPDDCQR